MRRESDRSLDTIGHLVKLKPYAPSAERFEAAAGVAGPGSTPNRGGDRNRISKLTYKPHEVSSFYQNHTVRDAAVRVDRPPGRDRSMRARIVMLTVVVGLLVGGGAVAEQVAGLPVHLQDLGPGAVRVWLGDHISSTAVVAVATARGIVVVDTFGVPKVDAELRGVIAKALGRKDFAMLINTHEHADHTGGNTAYSDCTIVGHTLCEAGMRTLAADAGRRQGWFADRVADLERQLADPEADPAAGPRLNEELILSRLQRDMFGDGVGIVPPTISFSDRMTLDMDDVTFELFSIGGMHSSSDIAVLVPERGLLLTGDTMADVWLTDTPGCLASFTARPGVVHDFPRLLANWQALLARRDEIRDLIPGHWNGDLSMAGFEARVDYVRALWTDVEDAFAGGADLGGLMAENRLGTRFPELVGSPGLDDRSHFGTVTEMWVSVSGQRSAALALYELLDGGAPADAVRAVVADRGREGAQHYFVEAEINFHGYRLLRSGKVPEAVRMFAINAELFPESWNVYDSWGEALLAAGDEDGARGKYRRSVALNPDNANGREALERLGVVED